MTQTIPLYFLLYNPIFQNFVSNLHLSLQKSVFLNLNDTHNVLPECAAQIFEIFAIFRNQDNIQYIENKAQIGRSNNKKGWWQIEEKTGVGSKTIQTSS